MTRGLSVNYVENKRRFSWHKEYPLIISQMEFGDIVEMEYNDVVRLILIIDNNYKNLVHAIDLSAMDVKMSERVFEFVLEGIDKIQLYANMTKLQIDKSYRTFKPQLIGLPILILRLDDSVLSQPKNYVKIGNSILIGYDDQSISLPLNHRMVYIDLIPKAIKNGLYFQEQESPDGIKPLEQFVNVHFTSSLRRVNYKMWYKHHEVLSAAAAVKHLAIHTAVEDTPEIEVAEVVMYKETRAKALIEKMREVSAVFFAEKDILRTVEHKLATGK